MFTWAALAAPFVRKRFQQRAIIIIYFLPRLRMFSRWKLASSNYSIVQSLPCLQTAEDISALFVWLGFHLLCARQLAVDYFAFILAASPLPWRNLKTEVSPWNRMKCFFFLSTLSRRNLKTQQSAVILDFCLRKTRSGKSHDYCNSILSKNSFLKMFSHWNAKPALSNSSLLKSVFEKFPFRSR